jgi:hypothetical protein
MDCIWNKLSTLTKKYNSKIQVKCTNTQKKGLELLPRDNMSEYPMTFPSFDNVIWTP